MKTKITKLKVKMLELVAKSLHKELPEDTRVKVYIGQDGKVVLSGYNPFPLDQQRLRQIGMQEW